MPKFIDAEWKGTVLASVPYPAVAPKAIIAAPPPGGTSTRDRERLQQGIGAVLSVRRAAELLPGDDKENRRWLRESGLIRKLNGKEVVVWKEVLDRLSEKGDTLAAPTPAKTRRSKGQALPRICLPRQER